MLCVAGIDIGSSFTKAVVITPAQHDEVFSANFATQILNGARPAYWDQNGGVPPFHAYLVAPVFALCSGITWALLWWRGGAPEIAGSIGGMFHQLFSNVLILGYNSLSYQANVPGWSLDMEMQFYLVAPVVAHVSKKTLLSRCSVNRGFFNSCARPA